MIKLCDLLATFELSTPFVIVYKDEDQYFRGVENLEEIKNAEALQGYVQLVWYSSSLYRAIVLEVYDNAE